MYLLYFNWVACLFINQANWSLNTDWSGDYIIGCRNFKNDLNNKLNTLSVTAKGSNWCVEVCITNLRMSARSTPEDLFIQFQTPLSRRQGRQGAMTGAGTEVTQRQVWKIWQLARANIFRSFWFNLTWVQLCSRSSCDFNFAYHVKFIFARVI